MKLDAERPWMVHGGKMLAAKHAHIDKEDEREAFFKAQCLQAFQMVLGAGKMQLPGPDFVGKRAKTEEDLQRIRSAQDQEHQRKKSKEDQQQQRYLAKFAKEAQVVSQERKQQEKRKQLQELQSLRQTKNSDLKRRKLNKLLGVDGDSNAQRADVDDDDRFDIEMQDAQGGETDRPSTASKKSGLKRGKAAPSKKRQHRDEKFGFGGRKRDLKRNTEESLNDDSSFSVRKNKQAFFGGGRSSRSAKVQKNRPGKQRRQQIRQRKGQRQPKGR